MKGWSNPSVNLKRNGAQGHRIWPMRNSARVETFSWHHRLRSWEFYDSLVAARAQRHLLQLLGRQVINSELKANFSFCTTGKCPDSSGSARLGRVAQTSRGFVSLHTKTPLALGSPQQHKGTPPLPRCFLHGREPLSLWVFPAKVEDASRMPP